jgi:hypothetical protein
LNAWPWRRAPRWARWRAGEAGVMFNTRWAGFPLGTLLVNLWAG